MYRELLDPKRRVVAAPAFLAGELALATFGRIEAGDEPGRVDPCYVRQSEAEINLKAGRL